MSHIGNNQEYQQNNRQVQQAQVQRQFSDWAVQTVNGFATAVQAKDSRFKEPAQFKQYFEDGLRKMLKDLPTYQPEEKQREVKEEEDESGRPFRQCQGCVYTWSRNAWDNGQGRIAHNNEDGTVVCSECRSEDDDSDGSVDVALDSVSLNDERSPMEDEAPDEQDELGDCSICTNPLSVNVDEEQNRLGNCVTLPQGFDEQRTPVPCGHSFHEVCIERWFIDRNYQQCPLCRAYHGHNLPQPVQEAQPDEVYLEEEEVPIVDPRSETSSQMVQNAFDAMGLRSDLDSLQQETSLIGTNYTSEDLSRRITLNYTQLSGRRENHRLVSAYNLGRYLTHYIRLNTAEGENPPSLRSICGRDRLNINPATASLSINFSNVIRRNGALRFLLTSTALWRDIRKCLVMIERGGAVSYLDRAFQDWRTANPDSDFLTDPLDDDDDDAPTADSDSD